MLNLNHFQTSAQKIQFVQKKKKIQSIQKTKRNPICPKPQPNFKNPNPIEKTLNLISKSLSLISIPICHNPKNLHQQLSCEVLQRRNAMRCDEQCSVTNGAVQRKC